MAKVVGVSGAQGAGKSTLLDALHCKGWFVDTFKVSRAVQNSLGWTRLDTVMLDVGTMVKFQEEVFKQKLERELYLRDQWAEGSGPDTIVLTERTFADIAAYATYWAWQHLERGNWSKMVAADWSLRFNRKCVEAMQSCYSGVLLLPLMDHVKWESDSNRAEVKSAEFIFDYITRFTEQPNLLKVRSKTITSASVPDRTVEVETFLKTLQS